MNQISESAKNSINILGQNFSIQSLIYICISIGIFFLVIIIIIFSILLYKNYKTSNSIWKKYKLEKEIYETEAEINNVINVLKENKQS